MKSLVFHQSQSPLVLEDRDEMVPGSGQVVVRLAAAAMNRRDYWITQGKYPGIQFPIVLGSDGVGVVSRVGPDVDNTWGEQQVIINPGWHWGDRQEAQTKEFQILGMPVDGTFAEEVLVPAEMLHPKPVHLNSAQAAALPLAGVTAFRALFSRAKLRAGENVLITGAGGGVSTFLVQFAKVAGANVYVSSSSAEKINNALGLGATAGFNYTDPDWAIQLTDSASSMDVIIDSGGGQNYRDLIDIAAFGGRIVNYGATAGPPEKLDIFKLYWKQLNLLGSTMGSPVDFAAMLEFVGQHKIEPVVDSIMPLSAGNEALQQMATSRQFGKLVLEI